MPLSRKTLKATTLNPKNIPPAYLDMSDRQRAHRGAFFLVEASDCKFILGLQAGRLITGWGLWSAVQKECFFRSEVRGCFS